MMDNEQPHEPFKIERFQAVEDARQQAKRDLGIAPRNSLEDFHPAEVGWARERVVLGMNFLDDHDFLGWRERILECSLDMCQYQSCALALAGGGMVGPDGKVLPRSCGEVSRAFRNLGLDIYCMGFMSDEYIGNDVLQLIWLEVARTTVAPTRLSRFEKILVWLGVDDPVRQKRRGTRSRAV